MQSAFSSGYVPANVGFELVVTNEYPALLTKGRYPWDHIVEPYKSTTLSLENGKAMAIWEISHVEDRVTLTDLAPKEATASAMYQFERPAQLYLVRATVSWSEETGEVTQQSEFKVMCKYVRREIRDLTQKDRIKYFKATEQFHRLTATEGREKYGQRWTNYAESTQKRLTKMTVDACTPLHSHVTLTTQEVGIAASPP